MAFGGKQNGGEEPTQADLDGKDAAVPLGELWRLVRGGRPSGLLLVSGMALLLVQTVASLAYPVLTRDVIDSMPGQGSVLNQVVASPTVMLLLAALVLSAVTSALCRFLLTKSGLSLSATLKKQLTAELLSKRVDYFDVRESGEHVSRVTNDAGAISKLLSDAAPNLVSGSLMLLGSATILFLMDVRLAGVLFGIIFAAFCLMLPAVGGMAKVTADQNNSVARLAARLTQLFGNIRLVKSFTAEPVEQARANAEIDRSFRHGVRAAAIISVLQPVITLAITIALVAIFLYGGSRIAEGTLSVGTLTAFILYIFNVISPLLQITTFVTQVQTARGAAVSLRGIFEAASEADRVVRTVDQRRTIVPVDGDLHFMGVQFSYPNCPPALIIDQLHIVRGSRTAVIGPSGSGKTTLLALVQRFGEPDHGSIVYDGQSIADLPLAAWRQRIGCVAQNAPLLSGTVRENILYGIEGPVAQERLEAAASAANCMEFIQALEAGFDTPVGEDGVRLSGGQRQRLAIARMFVRDPEILLLDEATSNLDVESEAAVLSALEALMEGRTTILVTHRLAKIENMDRIVVIEGGGIAASGSPSELSGSAGYFNRVSSKSFLKPEVVEAFGSAA